MVVFARLNRYLVLLLTLGITACSSWQRDEYDMPDASVINIEHRFWGWAVTPPDCHTRRYSSHHQGDTPRPVIPFGCATYTNLAASLARPQDLVVPQNYPGAQSDTATLSVTRYRENNVEPLRDTQSTEKTGAKR